MDSLIRLLVLSDIHHAGPMEQARQGRVPEDRSVLWQRLLLRAHRRFIWLENPLAHNHMLDRFLTQAGEPHWVVANGDYSCDSAYLGLCDNAAFESASICLGRLRERFGERFRGVIGDHELGKRSMAGGFGGLRLASLDRTERELGVPGFWRQEIGDYVMLGVTSTLIALPVYHREMLATEVEEWQSIRARHLQRIEQAFAELRPGQRVLLFCHDPTALPFLWRVPAVRARIGQLEQTIIGHLHSPLIYWQSRLLAGMPTLNRLGGTVRRLSTALNEAGSWRHFRVRLCPSLTGIELRRDGGFYEVDLDPEARRPARFKFHPLPWPEWAIGSLE